MLAAGTASEADARGVRPIGATWALTTERLSNERTLTRWANPLRSASIRADPSRRASHIGRLHTLTEDGLPEVYLALSSHRSSDGRVWIRVRIPERPNGQRAGSRVTRSDHCTRSRQRCWWTSADRAQRCAGAASSCGDRRPGRPVRSMSGTGSSRLVAVHQVGQQLARAAGRRRWRCTCCGCGTTSPSRCRASSSRGCARWGCPDRCRSRRGRARDGPGEVVGHRSSASSQDDLLPLPADPAHRAPQPVGVLVESCSATPFGQMWPRETGRRGRPGRR